MPDPTNQRCNVCGWLMAVIDVEPLGGPGTGIRVRYACVRDHNADKDV